MPARALLLFSLLALPWPALASHDAPATTSAIEEEQRQRPQMRFRAMDLNGDGIISRDEWQGSAQSFRMHDWNRDGVLSGDEVRVGGRRGEREDDFDPGTPDRFDNWTPQAFDRLDRNDDLRISRNEWPFAMETFWRVDRNGDNALSRQEFLGSEADDDDRDDRFDYLDANNDGRIERREWHGSLATFRWLDRNRDNILTRQEMVGTTPAGTDQFVALDFDNDGALTFDEWFWSRTSFDSRDLNRDGRLTRREFLDTAMADAEETATQTVHVHATERWTDTGILIRAGDSVSITADGSIRLSQDERDTATPAGSVRNRRAPNAPVANALAGGLIARIGETGPIFLGSDGSISSAPVSGRLYLSVNDDHLGDNAGEFRVTITIRTQAR